MTAFALAIFRADEVDRLPEHLGLASTGAGRLGVLRAEARDAICETFGPPRWSRLYFGNEFCERRTATVEQVRLVHRAATASGLGFSLLTSYATNHGLGAMRPLFEYLASLDDATIEVVANDWGVVRLVRREFPSLRVVLGRLLNRLLRDPRIMRQLVTAPAPEGTLAALQQSSVTVPVYRRFLAHLGIARVEFDHVIQGLDMDFRRLGLAASLYVPFGYIATGRACLMGSLRLPARKKFDVEAPCHRECQRYTLRFRYADSPFDTPAQEFLQRGNTFFYFQDRELIASAGRMVERLGIDRIVYQPDLPV